MINTGILNPQILSLLARVRHTNALVIADRGFPFWPKIETVDISLVDDVPTVLQVLAAVRANHQFHAGLSGAGIPKEQPASRPPEIHRRRCKACRRNSSRTWNSRSACHTPSA